VNQISSKYILLSLIVILGSTLRIYDLNHKSLWLDEIIAVNTTQLGMMNIFSFFWDFQSRSAPLYFMILHFFVLFGRDEFIVRLPSVIFGILSILLIYKVGELFFRRPREGLIGAFLLSISTMNVQLSQEATMYSLFMFLSLLSFFLFYKVIKENHQKLWIGFILATILGLFSHYYMLFVLFIEMLFFAFIMLKNRSSFIISVRKVGKKKIFLLVSGLMTISIILIRLLQNALYIIKTGLAWSPWGLKPTSLFEDLFNYFSFGFSSPFISNLYGSYVGASLLYVFLLFFLVGIFTSIREHREQTILLLLWVFLPTITVFILTFNVSSPIAAAKYMIFIIPGYLVGVSRGISQMANSLLKCYYKFNYGLSSIPMLERRQARVSLAITMVTMVAFTVVSVAPLQKYYKSENENWRAAARYLETNSTPGDIIFVEPHYCLQCVLYYYNADLEKTLVISRYLLTRFFNLSVEDVVSNYERIWFIYSSHAKLTDQEEKIEDWVLSNFFEAKRFPGISIFFKLPKGTIVARTKDMRFSGLDSPPNETKAEFWHNDDSASFNVSIVNNTNHTIMIHAKSITKSALELVIDDSSKGIMTFAADDWSYTELGTFYFDSGSHEIKLVNREGGNLGDTYVVFDQVIIRPSTLSLGL